MGRVLGGTLARIALETRSQEGHLQCGPGLQPENWDPERVPTWPPTAPDPCMQTASVMLDTALLLRVRGCGPCDPPPGNPGAVSPMRFTRAVTTRTGHWRRAPGSVCPLPWGPSSESHPGPTAPSLLRYDVSPRPPGKSPDPGWSRGRVTQRQPLFPAPRFQRRTRRAVEIDGAPAVPRPRAGPGGQSAPQACRAPASGERGFDGGEATG